MYPCELYPPDNPPRPSRPKAGSGPSLNKLGEILFIFQNSPYVMEKEFGPEVTHNKYETYFQGWQLIGDDVDDRDPNC